MEQKDKELLLKDISARLSYGLILKISGHDVKLTINNTWIYFGASDESKEYIKPYLRPLSSITEEEKKEYHELCDNYYGIYFDTVKSIDYLNEHHFDYRGLIEKGLAIAAVGENNPYDIKKK